MNWKALSLVATRSISPAEPAEPSFARLRRAESASRPLGDGSFLAPIEDLTKRAPNPRKPGPKPAASADTGSDLFGALSP